MVGQSAVALCQSRCGGHLRMGARRVVLSVYISSFAPPAHCSSSTKALSTSPASRISWQIKVFPPFGSPRYREYAEDIRVSSRHLLSLIESILGVTVIECRGGDRGVPQDSTAYGVLTGIVGACASALHPDIEHPSRRLRMIRCRAASRRLASESRQRAADIALRLLDLRRRGYVVLSRLRRVARRRSSADLILSARPLKRVADPLRRDEPGQSLR